MARLAAGELDRKIEIWRAPMVDDGTATIPGTPALFISRPAKKVDIRDGERLRASEMGQEVTARFVVRNDAQTRTITGKDTLVYVRRGVSKSYEITGVKDWDERDDAIEITATARPDQGA